MNLSRDLSTPCSVRVWLCLCFAAVLLMIVIGAVTRLTDSGLSMVEWRPIYGFLPPLSEAEWQRIFSLYRQIPEYHYQNIGMSLADFQKIFWWEYIHRLWGRLIGIFFVVPMMIFWWRGLLPPTWRAVLVVLLLLGSGQGLIGWWMVQSGLGENLNVSACRLMVHLGMALLILTILWWLILSSMPFSTSSKMLVSRETIRRLRQGSITLWLFAYATVLSGALVAGNDAGMVYNDWPLMGDAFLPEGYSGHRLQAWIDDQATVQFHHRTLAYTLVAMLLFFAGGLYYKKEIPSIIHRSVLLMLLIVGLQVGIGIATLLTVVSTPLAILHHANAVLILLIATGLLFRITHLVES